jgi:murein DD-endopeptidase MepM/ murein hydrolase activator NlpD
MKIQSYTSIFKISLFLASLLLSTYSCKSPIQKPAEIKNTPDTTSISYTPEHVFMYGIPSDLYDLTTDKIKRNFLLSDMLMRHGVTMQEIDQVITGSKSIFDVRKMRTGNNIILFCNKDSAAKLSYFVYEHDPTTCYVFSFNDSLNITEYRKAIKSEIKYATGTIETSLWDAMIGGGLHPTLAVSLSEVFAWTVDFFGLQKGDNFKVIYEELSIDGKVLGSSRIYGAQFNRSGTSISAIPFIQDDKEAFFDADGNSMRKAFLKAPLQFSRISSHFSSARMHPILRIVRPHYGVDYAAPIGTPVHAIGDGRITSATNEGGAGRMVRIQHNSVYATAYMHLSRFGEGVASGRMVKQGDIIGYVGTSGLSTGPHLDFRFYKNGSPVDPLRVEAPPVEPVSEANKAKFDKVRTAILGLLETIN